MQMQGQQQNARSCQHLFTRTKKKGTACGKVATKEYGGNTYCLVHWRMLMAAEPKDTLLLPDAPEMKKDVPQVQTYTVTEPSSEESSEEETELDTGQVFYGKRKRSEVGIPTRDQRLQWISRTRKKK